MSTQNNKRESGEYMGFSLSKSLTKKAQEVVQSKDWVDQDEVTPIPGAKGMVLVKGESKSFYDRLETKGVFMIPTKLKVTSSGQEVELDYFVCTK